MIIKFLQWLIDHPTFLSNQVYIGGDSYSGIPIPVIVQEISQGKKKKLINFYIIASFC